MPDAIWGDHEYYFKGETLKIGYEVKIDTGGEVAEDADVSEARIFKAKTPDQVSSEDTPDQTIELAKNGSGELSLDLSGFEPATDSPMVIQFFFEKTYNEGPREGETDTNDQTFCGVILAEPEVAELEFDGMEGSANGDALAGDSVTVKVKSWGAQTWDVAGEAPLFFSGADTARFASGYDGEVNWAEDGANNGTTGPECSYSVPDDKKGAEVVFEARRLSYELLESRAQPGTKPEAKLAVLDPKVIDVAGGEAHAVLTKGMTPTVKLDLGRDLEGDYAWTIEDEAVESDELAKQELELKITKAAENTDTGEVPIKVKFTSKESKKEYEAEYKPQVILLQMHLDADRDGTVDDDTEGLDTWEFGPGKKGAIVICNCDDDDSNDKQDFDDTTVNGGSDSSDLSPMELRRSTSSAFPSGWAIELKVSKKKALRVFEDPSGAGTNVIGPATASDTYTVADPSPQVITYGLEGAQFPGLTLPNGEVELTLTLTNPGGAAVFIQTAVVRISPFLLFHHLQETVEFYVVEAHDNARFRTDLDAAAGRAARSFPDGADDDRWMQDVMELGYVARPLTGGASDDWNMPVVFSSARNRKSITESVPKDELMGPNFGWYKEKTSGAYSSLDSFGNLECSPPVTVSGVDYKLGRIIYGKDTVDAGNNIQLEVVEFLESQRVQKPFWIDTGWLYVGHVDEAISFLPVSSAPKKFKIMIASPALGMEIIDALYADAAKRDTPFFEGLSPGPGSDYPWHTVKMFKEIGTIAADQAWVQSKLDGVEAKLRAELDLPAPADASKRYDPVHDHFIRIPVVFRKSGRTCKAYTADSVNMLVLTDSGGGSAKLIIPKPYGPYDGECLFEKSIKAELGKVGYGSSKVKFVDDFWEYHDQLGEIHCGTNSLRKPPSDVWWWELEGV